MKNKTARLAAHKTNPDRESNQLQDVALRAIAILLLTVPLLAQQIARPCCSIVSADPASGVVAARVTASGQGFQFTLTNRALTTRLRAGQGVYANCKAMQVSLDGRTVAGTILPAAVVVRQPPALPNIVPNTNAGGTTSALRATGVNIAGPVTGGNQTPGAVALSMIALAGGQIHLASNRPDLAAVPAVLPVPQNANRVNFTVKTFAAATPSDVSISAQFDNGTPAASGTFTVKPPEVSSIACSPGTVISGMPVSCKIVLNGTVAAAPVTIAGRQRSNPQSSGLPVNVTSNSPGAIASPGEVVVLPGTNEVSFSVPTIPIPQPDTVTLLAASAAWQTSTQVKLSPAAIRSLTCEGQTVSGSPTACSCHGTDLSTVGARIRLTAPAPQGLQVKLSFSSSAVRMPGSNSNVVDFPTGATYKDVWLQADPVATPTTVTVSAKDPLAGDTKSFSITIKPPDIRAVAFGSVQYCCQGLTSINSVPLGGQSVPVSVFLENLAPQSGMTFSTQYSGTTQITGPAQITVSGDRTIFAVKILPCGVNPPCQVHATVGGVTATLTVNP